MPNAPRTYDEIVRATVPEPDSSWRPTPEQEQRAYEGYRALDADEQQLYDRVAAALTSAGMDASGVQIEVDRDRVVLRGQVRDRDAMMKIPSIVGQVDGVSAVVDQLVIAA
ncbi:MAG TPA: BON domain-containing protein [Kofleriaceae bacterium]